jgi:hypothetical protein
VAVTVTAEALSTLLRARAPQAPAACDMPAETFIDIATGRAPAPAELAEFMPLMS